MGEEQEMEDTAENTPAQQDEDIHVPAQHAPPVTGRKTDKVTCNSPKQLNTVCTQEATRYILGGRSVVMGTSNELNSLLVQCPFADANTHTHIHTHRCKREYSLKQ